MKSIISIIFIFTINYCEKKHTNNVQSINYASVDIFIDNLIEKTNIPGMSVAVSKNNTIIYSKGFGFADIENQVKMSPNTQLRTASVAKIITATALGRLRTEGKLDFDAPIKNYVPYLREPLASLTTRQLAGHTSGLQHRPQPSKLENKYYTSTKETINLFNETELLFETETNYKYSTNGFNLLAAVIEGISGENYIDYMMDEIFTPLEMRRTFPENLSKLTAKDAKLYYFENGKLALDNQLNDGSYKLAGAGFRSTATDLVKMMNAYKNGFISANVVNEMFRSNKLKNGEETRVGIGWRLNFDMFGRSVIDHAGNWQGARTVIVYYPKEKLSIALMINAQCNILIEETAQIIAQMFLNDSLKKIPIKDLDKPINATFTNSQGEVTEYKGTFTIDSVGNGEISLDADREYLQSMPIYYLGFDDNYASMTSSFGPLYLKLKINPLSGKLFFYQNRNVKPPTDQIPMLSF